MIITIPRVKSTLNTILVLAMFVCSILTSTAFSAEPTDLQSPNVSDDHAKQKIKIDIISDVVCPWCAIGYSRLNQAIIELKMQDDIEIVWHPFQLNPDMPLEGNNADQYLMAKLGLSKEGLKNKRNSVTETGKESGFDFNYFAEMRKPNTLNAHILLDYAKAFDKQTALKVRLQKAYFSERKNIGNRKVLYQQLKQVGLNADEAIKTLDDNEIRQRVQNEEKHWRSLGVTAIPTMLFAQRLVTRGANSVERYKALLQQLHIKSNTNQ